MSDLDKDKQKKPRFIRRDSKDDTLVMPPEMSKTVFEEWRKEKGLESLQELWIYLGFGADHVPSWEKNQEKENNGS